ncbi:hypothetical protein CVT24_002340 [Panaeolus cyanescens]|uniref:Retrotransposon gag domain-containing protein n=1 Tax=Panaeolus cyanescens TaxID=181874 RepID=A0A409YIK0_9AGAR|nr:hypothetical protein CVT24_002340 [Panaeolus cyanescens]
MDFPSRLTRNVVHKEGLPLQAPLEPTRRTRRAHSADSFARRQEDSPSFIPRPVQKGKSIKSSSSSQPQVIPPLSISPLSSLSVSTSTSSSYSSMKLDITPLNDTLDAASINAWLDHCEDAFELHCSVTGKSMSVANQILAAGLKMLEPEAYQWWSQNRVTLKKLPDWKSFADEVRTRFVPGNWKLDALGTFCDTRQGSLSFPTYCKNLQLARAALGADLGKAYTISDAAMKMHLLFNANRILRLRVCANPTLDYATIKLDSLIALMTTTWNAMVAEGITTSSSSGHMKHRSQASNAPVASSSSATRAFLLPTLTPEEKEEIRAAGGCYNCRLLPSSPGWIKHLARDCPTRRSAGSKPVVGVMEGGRAIAKVMAVNVSQVEWSDEEYSDASSVVQWAAALKAGRPFRNAALSSGSSDSIQTDSE